MVECCCYCFPSSAEPWIVCSCNARLELLIPNPDISSCLTYLFLLCIFMVLKCDLVSAAIRIWLRGVGLAASERGARLDAVRGARPPIHQSEATIGGAFSSLALYGASCHHASPATSFSLHFLTRS